MDAFAAWAARFPEATEEEKARLLANGSQLVEERIAAMAELIRVAPQEALANALPYAVRKALPAEVAARIEQPVRTHGALTVIAVRPLPGATVEEPIYRQARTKTQFFDRVYTSGKRLDQRTTEETPLLGVSVRTPEGKVLLALREEPYEVLSKAETADIKAALGDVPTVCPVSGQLTASTGDETAVDTGGKLLWLCHGGHIEQWIQTPDGRLLVLAAGGSGTSGGTSTVVPATQSQGNKKFLALRVRFSNQAANYEPASDATMQTELQRVVDKMAKWSYGKLQSTFAFSPVLTMPQTDAWYAANGTEDKLRTDTLAAAAAYTDGTGAHPYDPANFDLPSVVFSTDAFGGYCGIASIGGNWNLVKCPSAYVFAHEWGHNLGLLHSNRWEPTTDSPIGPGAHVEYGGVFSTMGSAPLSGYDMVERWTLGWVTAADVSAPTTSGTVRLYNPDKSTLVAGHPYAIRVRKDTRTYSLEWRPNYNEDGATTTQTSNGIIVMWDQSGSQLLDMQPLTSAGTTDTPLLIGRTFSDLAQGIHITPIAKGGTSPDDYCDVVVNFDSGATNSPPVAVVTATNYAPAVNAAITLTAIATDPDGDTLAYWWDFGDGNTSLNNSATQSKLWGTAGDYNVRCIASDRRGKTSAQNVVIHVGTPATFSISGRVTTSAGVPASEVLIHDDANHLTYTDSDGRYTLGSLAAANYTVSATHDGWALNATFANPIAVGPSNTTANFTATAPTGGIGITLEHWDGIGGPLVSDLTSNARYPASPDYRYVLESIFEAGENVADSYGQRARGWFRAPSTGAYTFYIASDDASELWLSTNDVAANKVKIASVVGYVNKRDWTAQTSQHSAAITLTAGQRYYIEALQKEAVGGDHLSVGVDFPGGAQHRPIESQYLDPITATTPVAPANTLTVAATDAAASETGPDAGTFTITRTGSTAAALTVYFDMTGTATYASDYSATGLSATIAAGATTTTVTVTPVDDAAVETDETVILTLSPATTYALGATTSATVTIADNEPAQVSVAATDATANESGNTGTFTITRTGSTAAALTVNFTLGGSATNGTDYATPGTSIVIPIAQGSAAITITPTADGVVEVDETVTLTVTTGAGYTVGAPSTASLTITGDPGNGGGILREWFDGLNGNNTVGDLLLAAAYPFSPTGSEIVTTSFETPQSSPDKNNFGERWRAIYTAPVTGNYFFYIASDDASELWLSTDATPDRKQRICYASSATGFEVWTAQGNQKSATIALTAGQRYYIEALFKEGAGGDYMSVGVEYPNGALERPIPAHRLDPYTPATALGSPWAGSNIGTGPLGGGGLASDFLPAGPKARYSFSGTASAAIADGTSIADSIGTAAAALRGAGAIYNAAGTAIVLPGGTPATQAYLDLPNGVITGTINSGTRYTSASYETWVTVNTTQNWARIFNFGTSSVGEVTTVGGTFDGNDAHHIFLTANDGTTNDQRLARNYPAGTNDVTSVSTGTAVNGTQFHIVLTYDAVDQNWRWYRNGVLMQVLPDAQGLTTLNDVNNWLGRSMWSSDINLNGTYDEFRIYDYALTEAQIRGNKDAGPNVINTLNIGATGPYWVSGSGVLSTSGASDALHLESQSLTGDWDVRVRLASLANSNAGALAGLMMREGTAAGARHAFIGLNPAATGRFIARTTTNGNATTTDLTGLAIPQWLRLARQGDSISAYVSADGATWQAVGTAATFSGLSASLNVGFAVSGGATNKTALAQFDTFSPSPAPGAGDGLRYERFEGIAGATVASLTSAASFPNSPTLTEIRGGLFEVAQSSPAIDNYGDRMRGYFVPTSTGSYTFYVAGDDSAELWLSTNDSVSARVKIASVPSYTALREWAKFPQQKSAPIALTAGQRYYMELLHKEATGNDFVSVGVVLPGGVPEFPMLASRFQSFTLPATFLAPWTAADVGAPPSTGSAGYFPPSYTGSSDPLVFGPRNRYTFDGAASAAVVDGAWFYDVIAGANAQTRGAGAMFDALGKGIALPGGASATAAYVDLPNGVASGTINGGTRFGSVSYELWATQTSNQNWSRILDFGTGSAGEITSAGGSATGTNYIVLSGNNGLAPDTRFERKTTTTDALANATAGTVLGQFTHHVVEYDAAAQQWRWYRNGVLTASFADAAGVATLADVNVWLGRSQFTSDADWNGTMHEFRIYDYALTAPQVQGNLAAGPDALNVAAPGLAGSALISGGGAISTTSTSDSFQFASQTMDGDGEIIARLVSFQGASTRAGIMLRENTAVGSRHVIVGVLNGGAGSLVKRTATAGNASVASFTTTGYWLRLVRKGDVVTAYTSANGSAWTAVAGGATTLTTLPANVLVGLAVSSGTTTTVDASFDNVQIIRPTVSIARAADAVEFPTSNGVFTVARTWDTTSALTVNYSVSGSATSGVDFTALSGSVTIPAGQASATITVVPVDDSISEGLETVVVTLTDAIGYTLGAQSSDTLAISGAEPSYVWSNATIGSTLAWTLGANWLGAAPALSSAGTTVEFLTGQTLAAGTVTANNDNAGTFQLTSLKLSGTGPASGAATVALAGNAIQLTGVGIAPVVALDAASGAGLTYTVANALTLAADTTFTGTGTASFVWAGAITGSGALTKAGSSTLILAGNDNYAGSTTIAGGTLQLGNGTASGSLGGGAINNSGTLFFYRSDTALNISSIISGSGSILVGVDATPANDSRVTLSGVNTFTGGITIRSGGLRITNSNALGNPAIAKTIAINKNGAAPLPRPQLLLDGTAGAIVLPATFSISASNGDAVYAALINEAGTNTIAGNFTLNGGGGGTRILASGGNITLSGSIAPSTSARVLQLDGTATGAVSGVIQNQASPVNTLAVEKSGTGTWTLSAANTYTGATTVLAGNLIVSGSIATGGSVSVSSGATLSGSGTIAASTAVSGTHAPGAGLGKQTISGALSYSATAHLAWELGSNTATGAGTTFDQVAAAAGVTITSGAVLDVLVNSAGSTVNFSDPFWAQSHTWPVLTATTLTGSFALGTVTADLGARVASDYGTFTLQQSGGVSLVWTPLASFVSWQHLQFGVNWNVPSTAGDLANPDADALPNLLEYALGTSPTAQTLAPAAAIVAGKLTLTFPRNPSATDITITVQGADSLAGPWADLANAVNGAATTALLGGVSATEAGTPPTVEVRDLYQTNDPLHPRRYLRLRAVR